MDIWQPFLLFVALAGRNFAYLVLPSKWKETGTRKETFGLFLKERSTLLHMLRSINEEINDLINQSVNQLLNQQQSANVYSRVELQIKVSELSLNMVIALRWEF